MIHHFDHRWGTYEGQTTAQANQGKLPELEEAMHVNPDLCSLPRYWVSGMEVHSRARNWSRNWLFGFRNITGATVLRTVIATLTPKAAVGHSMPLIFPVVEALQCASLSALLASFASDYTMRQKLGGINLTFGYFNQLAAPRPEDFLRLCTWANSTLTLGHWLLPRVLELTYTAWDLRPFSRDCGYDGSPFRWDSERRFLLRAELDAAFFHLYLGGEQEWNEKGSGELLGHFPTPRHAVEYIMETFPIVKRKDEQAHGHYRTKDTILEIYDEMAEVIAINAVEAAGQQPTARYQTRLDPPPGPPCDEEGSFIPLPHWEPGRPRPENWPVHIHPPREVGEYERKAPAAPIVIGRDAEIDLDRVIAAFGEVRDGMSADYVIACPEANARFLGAARELGERAEPRRINQALINARKAGKLSGEPSEGQYRLPREVEPYAFVCEWAVRHLQRNLLKEIDRSVALDELLCNPEWAGRFDELAARIKPGFEPLEYRWAALGMRKKSKTRPDDASLQIPMQRQMTLWELLEPDLPVGAGVYLISSHERPLYVNQALDLHDQVGRHREVAGQALVPDWLLEGVGRPEELSYTYLQGWHLRRLQELRSVKVTELQPWLNLLDTDEVA
jgi:hypothetical protein